MEERRVVVTGLGAVTPVGNDVETMWNNLISGRSGIDFLTRLDKEQFPAKVAAEVKDFDPLVHIEKRDVRKVDLFTQCAVASAKMAVADAGLTIDDSNANRVGVWIGSGIGGTTTYEEQFHKFQKKGYRRVSPFFVPMMIPDMAAGQVSIQLGAKG